MSKTLARLLLGALAVALVAACGGAASTPTGPSSGRAPGFTGTTRRGRPQSIPALTRSSLAPRRPPPAPTTHTPPPATR